MPSPNPARTNPAQTLAARERELRGMEIFVGQVIGQFRLALALHNDPLVRDARIQELSSKLRAQSIQVIVADLDLQAGAGTLLDQVKIAVSKTEPGFRPAIMLVNLENKVAYNPELPGNPSEEVDYLHTANFHRELFVAACPCPLIIWVTELLELAFVKQAPDLWHWRSHVFDLRVSSSSMDELLEDEVGQPQPGQSTNNLKQRIEKLLEELVAYRENGQDFEEMRTLSRIGSARLEAGDFVLARRDHQAVLQMAQRQQNPGWQIAAMGNLGSALAELGDFEQAETLLEQSRKLANANGDLKSEAAALTNLGVLSRRRGQLDQALAFHQMSMELAKMAGEHQIAANALMNLANVHADLNDMVTASQLSAERLKLAEEAGDLRGQAGALGLLGVVYRQAGDLDKALALYEQQKALAQKVGDRRMEARAIWNSAVALGVQNRQQEALQRAKDALKLFKATHSPKAADIEKFISEVEQASLAS